MTKKIIVEIDDNLDKEFRDTLVRAKGYGFKKGVIKKALEQAIRDWIKKYAK